MSTNETPGQIAYAAYVKTVTHKPRLRWEFLPSRTQRAWEAAAVAVAVAWQAQPRLAETGEATPC